MKLNIVFMRWLLPLAKRQNMRLNTLFLRFECLRNQNSKLVFLHIDLCFIMQADDTFGTRCNSNTINLLHLQWLYWLKRNVRFVFFAFGWASSFFLGLLPLFYFFVDTLMQLEGAFAFATVALFVQGNLLRLLLSLKHTDWIFMRVFFNWGERRVKLQHWLLYPTTDLRFYYFERGLASQLLLDRSVTIELVDLIVQILFILHELEVKLCKPNPETHIKVCNDASAGLQLLLNVYWD